MSLPYLDIKNADVFESPRKHFVRESGSLSHTAAIALLKIRLLIDVRTLQNSSMISYKIPREIFDSVRRQLVSSSVVAEIKDIMSSHDQVQDLYAAVKNLNQYFWPILLNPGEHLHPRSEIWNCGSLEEVRVVLQRSYDVWMETPGAVDVIRELVKRSVKLASPLYPHSRQSAPPERPPPRRRTIGSNQALPMVLSPNDFPHPPMSPSTHNSYCLPKRTQHIPPPTADVLSTHASAPHPQKAREKRIAE